MTGTPLFIIDAFVGELKDQHLRGNPAAVVLLQEAASEVWMQSVAAEMNLSETAFVAPSENGDFALRWFTPVAEVALCGHATLASAHALLESGILNSNQEVRFHTLSGLLVAKSISEGIVLDFPTQPVKIASAPVGLGAALGLPVSMPFSCWKAEDDWLIELPVNSVEALKPDFAALDYVCRRIQCRGVIVTSRSEIQGIDFISRFFGPAVGINEDPVTGSAHTKLAPFWGKQLGKTEMVGYQASSRGGIVRVHWHRERVELVGRAKTFLRGNLA